MHARLPSYGVLSPYGHEPTFCCETHTDQKATIGLAGVNSTVVENTFIRSAAVGSNSVGSAVVEAQEQKSWPKTSFSASNI